MRGLKVDWVVVVVYLTEDVGVVFAEASEIHCGVFGWDNVFKALKI